MIINKPSCDYMRMATWNESRYESLSHAVFSSSKHETRSEGKWLNYKGYVNPDAFCGQGKQKQRWHAVGHVSGETAEMFLHWDMPEDIYCTRADVQVTVLAPSRYDALKFQQKLDEEVSGWSGRKRKSLLIKGAAGEGDTVGIGSRDSDKFVRVYEKFSDDGVRYLRFEIEFKRQLARKVYPLIRDDFSSVHAMNELIIEELHTLPDCWEVRFLSVAVWTNVLIQSAVPLLSMSQNTTRQWNGYKQPSRAQYTG